MRRIALSEIEAVRHIARTALLRRNLTAGQKGAVVASMEDLLAGLEAEARDRQREGAREGGETAGRGRPKPDSLRATLPEPKPASDPEALRPRTQVARLAGISARTAQDVLTVKERGLETFVDVGLALMEIRDRRLYRDTHATFE